MGIPYCVTRAFFVQLTEDAAIFAIIVALCKSLVNAFGEFIECSFFVVFIFCLFFFFF